MHEYGFAPLRVRGVDRVALHADLTMLARLSQALARARAVRLAAYTSLTTDDQTQRILWWFALTVALGAVVWLIAFPRVGTDLSAQIARADWARHYPGSAYLFSWYDGIYPASYSLLAPYLLAVSGTRASIAAATVLAASFVLRAS